MGINLEALKQELNEGSFVTLSLSQDKFTITSQSDKFNLVKDENNKFKQFDTFFEMCSRLELFSEQALIVNIRKREFLYFLIPYSEMDRLGIKHGDSEHQISKVLCGKDDCLYFKDLIRDFHHLDKNIIFPSEILFLNNPLAGGLTIEWGKVDGNVVDISYGVFAEHAGVKAMMSETAWKNDVALNNEELNLMKERQKF